MYNRYIPQPDGSFRRSRIPDHKPRSQSPVPPPPQQESSKEACPPEAPPLHPPRQKPRRPISRPGCTRRPEENGGGNVSGFLKQLIPRNFDTGDLLVVILLLLMAADCQEDQNTALLTLALYFFL